MIEFGIGKPARYLLLAWRNRRQNLAERQALEAVVGRRGDHLLDDVGLSRAEAEMALRWPGKATGWRPQRSGDKALATHTGSACEITTAPLPPSLRNTSRSRIS